MLVKRKIPKRARKIELTSNGGFGMVNLSWPICQTTIQDIRSLDAINIDWNDELMIYFPSFDYFYTKPYTLRRWTLETLIKKIAKTGYDMLVNWHALHPGDFIGVVTPQEAGSSVGEYALCEFYVYGNKIYVNVEH